MNCLGCELTIDDDSSFCPHCGAAQVRRQGSGVRIPNYEIVSMVAEDACGVTYLVRHVHVDVKRLVRVMHGREADDADADAAFRREAFALASLHHPSLLAVHEFGHLDTGEAYVVLERTTGRRLTDVCYSLAVGLRGRLLASPRASGASSARSSPTASSAGVAEGSSSPVPPAKQRHIRHKNPMNIWSGPPSAHFGDHSGFTWRG